MQSVILAAGRGTRLHPFTAHRSKAMMPIVGKPIVERVMEMIAASGTDKFILVVSRDDPDIRRYFEHESEFRGCVTLVEQPERQGTADALSCAAHLLRGDFILSACDNLVPGKDLQKMLTAWKDESKPDGVLSLLQTSKETISKSGAVVLDGCLVTRIVEKPNPDEAPSNMASLPLYIFSPKILDHLNKVKPSQRGEYELQDAIQMLIESGGKIQGIHVSERTTLTNSADLLAINLRFLQERLSRRVSQKDASHRDRRGGEAQTFIEPYFIEAGTTIGKYCTIGPNVFIERNCRVGNHVRIENAVVFRGTAIQAGTIIQNQVVSN